MSIPIEPEPAGLGAACERCCFCRAITNTWTAIDARQPGDQVACCPKCAEHAEPEAAPGKSEWCEREAIACGPRHGDSHEWSLARKAYARAKR